MNIHVLSDLHLECAFLMPPANDADVVVLPGDIGVSAQGVQWAKDFFEVPVIYVAGNHEYYNPDLSMPEHKALIREVCADSNINFLDNDVVFINGVRFIGSTLWTDMTKAPGALYSDMERIVVGYDVDRYLGDLIHFSEEYAQRLFERNRAWLAAELSNPFDGKTVVVTHHAPSHGSVHAQYAVNPWNPCFISNLEYLMGDNVDLWLHGHTHNNFDYRVNGTRVVCNPRGYPNPLGGWENRTFDPGLMIQLELMNDKKCG